MLLKDGRLLQLSAEGNYFVTNKPNKMNQEKIVWTWDEYVTRVHQMEEMGMSFYQIACVLECISITSDKPMFHISEE